MLLPVLDTAPGTSLWTAWVARPQVMAPLLLLIAAYTIALVRLQRAGARRPAGWRIGSYYAGMALLIVALLGPLDVFNDTVFFLHMLQHMVLIQIAAPLIALGQPLQVVVRALPPRHACSTTTSTRSRTPRCGSCVPWWRAGRAESATATTA